MEWLPLITAVLSLLGIIVKTWQDGAPVRKEASRNAEIQQGREDIASGNAAAVGTRIDSVPSATGHIAKLGPDEDTARRLAEITGG